MIFIEKHKDLFTVDKEYYLAHCIASDLGMGAGIAVAMQKKFNLRGKIEKSGMSLNHPTCILTSRVFNLITKKRSSGKPTYPSFTETIRRMKIISDREGVKKLAIPKIGCGLDGLSWPIVRDILKKIFKGLDIEILVCKWN